MESKTLTNKIAVVTGASKGIGRQIALDLADAGADVAISARSRELLDTLAKEIEAKGRKAFVFVGDMGDEKDIQAFINQTVNTFGGIDILINNAGIGHFYSIAEMSTRHWDAMFNLNVRGLFIATREALPHLRKSDAPFVVNIDSLAGKNSFPKGGGYAATKHAVLAFTRCLMLEERKNGIRTLAICPGSVFTSFSDHDEGSYPLAPETKALKPTDISSAVLHALNLPPHALISEIDIRPANP